MKTLASALCCLLLSAPAFAGHQASPHQEHDVHQEPLAACAAPPPPLDDLFVHYASHHRPADLAFLGRYGLHPVGLGVQDSLRVKGAPRAICASLRAQSPTSPRTAVACGRAVGVATSR